MPYPLTGNPLSANLQVQQVQAPVELTDPARVALGLVGAPRTGALLSWPVVTATSVPAPVVTGQIWPRSGTPGPAGVGVPAGGAVDQVLAKASSADYATAWVTIP